MPRRIFFWLLVLFLLAIPAAKAQTVCESVCYEQFDVAIEINPDGSFWVRETQVIGFDGEYTTAFAEISREFTDRIRQVKVYEGETAYMARTVLSNAGEFTVETADEFVYVDWQYEPTSAGETRTFVVEYLVEGGLFVYPQEQRLDWVVIPADAEGLPVLSSEITVTLPAGSDPTEATATAFTDANWAISYNDNQLIVTIDEPIEPAGGVNLLLQFPPDWTSAEIQPWQVAADAAELEFRLEEIAVDMVINADGTVLINEGQTVSVQGGALHSGFESVTLRLTDAVANIQIYEGETAFELNPDDCDYCFWVEELPRQANWVRYDAANNDIVFDERAFGEIFFTWDFPPLVSGDQTTFELQYDAIGVIQLLEAEQRLTWPVVSGFNVPIERASVLLTLPSGLSLDEVVIEGGIAVRQADGRYLIEHEGAVPAGSTWRIDVVLPLEATAATKPGWQQDVEAAIADQQAAAEARQAAEARRAQSQLGIGVLGGFLTVVGLLGVVVAWYLRGRDEPAGLVPEYLTEPPSDLPPGVVAYLRDEEATAKGALSSLFHLATLGLLRIKIDDGEEIYLQRNYDEKLEPNQIITNGSGQLVTVPGHLHYLFNELFDVIRAEYTSPLNAIMGSFRKTLPYLYHLMGEEAASFFDSRPEQTRYRWLSIGQWLVLASVIIAVVVAIGFRGEYGNVVFLPPLGLLLTGAALALVSRWMPRRTSRGVEALAQWEAFRVYLENLKEYGDEAAAQTALDEYFPYAVALDVDEVVLREAQAQQSKVPIWSLPRPVVLQDNRPVARSSQRTEEILSQPKSEGGNRPVLKPQSPHDRPDFSLEGLSDRLTRQLNTANNSLTGVLNTAIGDDKDTPFELVVRGAGEVTKFSWKAGTSIAEAVGDVLVSSIENSGGSGGGYSGSSSSSRRRSSSSRRSSTGGSRRSSRSSSRSRSSSSRRSSGRSGRRGVR